MGEQSLPPHENGVSNSKDDPVDEEMDSGTEETEEVEEMSPEEFEKLDSQLDELNSALDQIEQKNDVIHAQLLELLHANREIRQQLQASNEPNNLPAQMQD